MSPRVGLDTDTIVNAAIEMADAEGIEAVTLASLAKKLKIRPPSLYNHIAGLDALKKEMAIYGLELLYEKLVEAATNKSGDDAIRALSLAYVTFVRAHPGLYDATLIGSDPNDKDIQNTGNKIVVLVIQALSVYNLTPDGSLHAVRGLRSILHGFSTLEQKGGFGLPLDVNVSLKLLLDAFLKGIKTMDKEN